MGQKDPQQISEEENLPLAGGGGTGSMAGTGYPRPLIIFDSLDPRMVIVDGTTGKKKHRQVHSSHRCM